MKILENCRRRRALSKLAIDSTSSQSSAPISTIGLCTSTETSNSKVLENDIVLVGTARRN